MNPNDTGVRYAMVKYPGDGVTTDFNVNFDGGWLQDANVLAYAQNDDDPDDIINLAVTILDEVSVTPGRVRVAPVPATGYTVVIYRRTQRGDPLVDFVNRSMITAENLNTITEQAIFSVAELEDQFNELSVNIGNQADNALLVANQALTVANEAKAEVVAATNAANAANATAAAANTKADQAVAAVQGAYDAAAQATQAAQDATSAAEAATSLVESIQGEVDAAVETANAASEKADEAASVALGLGDRIDSAVETANEALTTANGVDAKAQSALDLANTKVDRAGDTITGDLVVQGAIVQGAAANAQLTIASDAGNVYTEALNLATNTRKEWSSYASVFSYTFNAAGNGVGWRPNDGTHMLRMVVNGGVTMFQACNAAQSAVTPLVMEGSEVQLRTGGSIAVKATPASVRVEYRQVQSYRPDFNPGNGTINAAFRAEGNFGGGYAMQDGSIYSAMYMASGSIIWGISAGQIGNQMSLSSGGNWNCSGIATAGGGFGPGSDPSLKQDLLPHYNVLDLIDLLDVQTGRYIDSYNPDGRIRSFLMADDVMADVLPNVIIPVPYKGGTVRGWSADQMIAVLVKAVQELRAELNELKEKDND